ncbi:MAG: Acetophenone carboxylase gamma subunit [Syntrophorhabdus sp. PtaU1.Bin050]|nr:MAG: Acetophenone carboxylase gamma subunit [Syntrophorhabdus sp. PtaU1.Bin050]
MYKVCVDIGGTFTDCVVSDEQGNLRQFKAPSTPKNFEQGVMDALGEAAAGYGLTPEKFISQVELLVHGCTVATNAVVTRNLAKTALITTKGFRDIIEMRRANKIETKSMYEAIIPPYEPIVPRYLRFVMEEETRYDGTIAKPINKGELKVIIEKLKKEKVEAVAVAFINSYANPENERTTAELCQEFLGEEVFVTYSADILPTMGEYERASTAVVSACVGPVVKKYTTALEKNLEAQGFKGQLFIIQANQLAQSVTALKRKPVYLIGSGPSAAPAGGVFLGDIIGEPNFLGGDMGGTTFDGSVIYKGVVSLTSGYWLGDERVGIKAVDVVSIGAGGGSIGWINSLGLLQVGPQSAGADPGPCCYNKGGTEPTVADAVVVLGYIPAGEFWGGKMKLDIGLAKVAIKKIADRLGMTVEQAAQAMFTTVNANMADGITEISTKKGYDVRDFSLLAIGGSTAFCAMFIADLLNVKKVIIPKFAPTFSAWSMFCLDIGRDYVRSHICPLGKANPDDINHLYEDMIGEALKEFEVLNVGRRDLTLIKSADVRYAGQYHEVEVKLPAGDVTAQDIEQIAQEFHKTHQEIYTFSMPWVPVELRNLRLIAKSKGQKIQMATIESGTADASAALKPKRLCCFNGSYKETNIYDAEKLKAGNVIPGTAIIEHPLTTTVVPEGWQCTVDQYGNFIVRRT